LRQYRLELVRAIRLEVGLSDEVAGDLRAISCSHRAAIEAKRLKADSPAMMVHSGGSTARIRIIGIPANEGTVARRSGGEAELGHAFMTIKARARK